MPTRIVSIDLKDAPIDAALQSLFPSGNGIDYAIKNRKILLSAGKQSLHVDTVVSGRVADDQNRPLVGATVVVAGHFAGYDDRSRREFLAARKCC